MLIKTCHVIVLLDISAKKLIEVNRMTNNTHFLTVGIDSAHLKLRNQKCSVGKLYEPIV